MVARWYRAGCRDPAQDVAAFKAGQGQVLIGTPGRLADLMRRCTSLETRRLEVLPSLGITLMGFPARFGSWCTHLRQRHICSLPSGGSHFVCSSHIVCHTLRSSAYRRCSSWTRRTGFWTWGSRRSWTRSWAACPGSAAPVRAPPRGLGPADRVRSSLSLPRCSAARRPHCSTRRCVPRRRPLLGDADGGGGGAGAGGAAQPCARQRCGVAAAAAHLGSGRTRTT